MFCFSGITEMVYRYLSPLFVIHVFLPIPLETNQPATSQKLKNEHHRETTRNLRPQKPKYFEQLNCMKRSI